MYKGVKQANGIGVQSEEQREGETKARERIREDIGFVLLGLE
jgi:hypothetical protein